MHTHIRGTIKNWWDMNKINSLILGVGGGGGKKPPNVYHVTLIYTYSMARTNATNQYFTR